jgi:hypothetical protein
LSVSKARGDCEKADEIHHHAKLLLLLFRARRVIGTALLCLVVPKGRMPPERFHIWAESSLQNNKQLSCSWARANEIERQVCEAAILSRHSLPIHSRGQNKPSIIVLVRPAAAENISFAYWTDTLLDKTRLWIIIFIQIKY